MFTTFVLLFVLDQAKATTPAKATPATAALDSESESESEDETVPEPVSSDVAKKHYDEKDNVQQALLAKEMTMACSKSQKHFDLLSFAPYNAPYFTEKQLGKDNYPKECLTCGLKFTAHTPPKEETFWYKVDAKHVVFGCPNAFNCNSNCLKAFCQPCHSSTIARLGGRRVRVRNNLMHGEFKDREGNIGTIY